MISRIDLRGDALPEGPALRDLLPRAEVDVEAALEKVRPICEDVHHRGDAALIEYARAVRRRAAGVASGCPPRRSPTRWRSSTRRSARRWRSRSARARLVHRDQRRTDVTTQVVPGGTVTERWVPVDRVGLYVPGRPRGLPVVRGHERGARRRRPASSPSPSPRPPQAEYGGLPHPTILAACALLGVDEVYAVGGAQAVAMFAYGTEAECRARSTWSPAPATSTSPPPSGCSRAGSASTPRPARPRSRSSPTTPPTRCTSPPT